MEQIQSLKLSEIKPDPNNPRRNVGDVTELATSVKAHGILQPILVRKNGKGYIVIAGERRLAAALMVASENGGGGKNAVIPAIVKDVDDNAAFEIQTIENLQREDLPPYNEAYAFKQYLERFGPDYVDSLAERIGCSPAYIRSRAAVFELPVKILKSWEKGKIAWGHVNAMLLIKDDDEYLKTIFEYAEDGNSVKSIVERIKNHSTQLSTAIFKIAECKDCGNNSDKQKMLFDVGHEKAHCAKIDCFVEKTKAHLDAIFADLKGAQRKKLGTNGYLLSIGYNDRQTVQIFEKWVKGPFSECKACEKFVSIFALNGKSEKACADPACHKKLSKAGSASERKKAKAEIPVAATKCAWHGKLFREKFYMERIPAKAAEIKPDSAEALRTAILALTLSHGMRDELADWIGAARADLTTGADMMEWLNNTSIEDCLELLRDLSVKTIMTWDEHRSGFNTVTRDAVAKAFGIDIVAEWKPTEEYLQAKRRKELITWISTLPKDDAMTIKDYGMKRGMTTLDTAKKPEIIKAILGCGVDFTGRTPDEIVNYDQTASVPYNKKPGREE